MVSLFVFLVLFQIYILGSLTSAPNDYIEVFDAKNKTIMRVVDNQSNWIQVPIPGLTSFVQYSCIVPMISESAFVILGGLIP